jgi:hypothetical protein
MATAVYLLSAVIVSVWMRRCRPRVMHLILGGAYVALPMQFIRRAPSAVVSVVSPSLRKLVGAWPGVLLYRRARAIWEKSLGNEHPYVAAALSSSANLLSDEGRHRESLPLLERALRIRQKQLSRLARST